jgi:hypothetical protein
MALNRVFFTLAGLFSVFPLYAEETRQTTHTFSSVIGTILEWAKVLTNLLWVACVLIAISLVILSFIFYRAHRFNPKMVPLGKPIMYLVLGIAVGCVPFLDKIFMETGSPHEQTKKNQPIETVIMDIDAPLYPNEPGS